MKQQLQFQVNTEITKLIDISNTQTITVKTRNLTF